MGKSEIEFKVFHCYGSNITTNKIVCTKEVYHENYYVL